MTSQATIEFPEGQVFNMLFLRDSIAFGAVVDGRKFVCYATKEYLHSHHGVPFKSSEETPSDPSSYERRWLEAFEANRAAIQTVAAFLIMSGQADANGDVRLV